MLVKATGRSKIKFALAFMVMVTMFSAMWGCGGGGGVFDTIYSSVTRLLSVETLKSWIDAGKVNSGSYDNVVILDINYDANQHIPGAQNLNMAGMYQIRTEGVASTDSMVLSGAAMDSLIKGFGINVNTTVVFTGSHWKVTRAYFTFRYWGFPKENLFILNGLNKKWALSYPFTDQEAVVTASEFSVRDNDQLGDTLRYSLGEMMAAVKKGSDDTVFVDMRGPGGTYDGTSNTKNYVLLGHPKGAKAGPDYKTDKLFVDYAGGDYTFIDPNDLRDKFAALNLSSSKTGIMYCTSGNLATIGYFILEGILNWPAAVYDGSWKQWGLMSDNADKDGSLPKGCVFAVDARDEDTNKLIFMDPNGFTYAEDTYTGTWAVPPVNLIDDATSMTFTSTSDTRANQIENEDAAYIAGDEEEADTGAGDAGAAGGGDDSCG